MKLATMAAYQQILQKRRTSLGDNSSPVRSVAALKANHQIFGRVSMSDTHAPK